VVPPILAGFAQMRALSKGNDDPQAASRPFDAARDGFVLAEGAGALLLECADSASARGARIYAEIAGYGQSSDAYHEVAPSPDGSGPARAIAAALADSGLRAEDIGYVNAHGTSTHLSDLAETKALKLALGEHSRRVAISSTKSMTGHSLGAAGAIEAVATVLALDTGLIPPTINLEKPDPECDLDYVPGQARAAEFDAALSLSMGFGGHNACLAFRGYQKENHGSGD
jgi:3-oxoacyl-[acyl-carrier-protein] synthase II